LGVDITDLQEGLTAVRTEAIAPRARLADLTISLIGRTPSFDETVVLIRDPVVALVPEMNVGLGWQRGNEFEFLMIHQTYGERSLGDRGRFQAAQRDHW
jgi:hypothetical protein